MARHAIAAEALTKYYGKTRGIDHLNLTVEPGEFFGFIGPNGAGKSTTIRTLLGLISPDSGRGSVLDLDIAGNRKEILERVGYLPSDNAFYTGMRVGDMLKLSAGLRKKDCRVRAAELCDRLQLDTGKKVEELSFGNRKKAGIVCALQHDPELLILDEPTGVTVFLSSHVLSEIQHNCTRAAIIREGQVIACDSVEYLAQSNTRRVMLRGDVAPEDLPAVKKWKEEEGTISFLYSGSMNDLIGRLAGRDVQDLTITEPDLEEIILHYYGKEGEQA